MPTVEIIQAGSTKYAQSEEDVKRTHCKELMKAISDKLREGVDINVINNVETILSKTLMYLDETGMDGATLTEIEEQTNGSPVLPMPDDAELIIDCNGIKSEEFEDDDILLHSTDGRTKIVVINV